MADYYRDTIARVTQEFATGIAVGTNQAPEQLYKDLAWRGLMNYDDIEAWHHIVDNNPNEATRIENAINNFVTNNKNESCTD